MGIICFGCLAYIKLLPASSKDRSQMRVALRLGIDPHSQEGFALPNEAEGLLLRLSVCCSRAVGIRYCTKAECGSLREDCAGIKNSA